MAFVKDKTGSAQTAANASATLVAAFADQFGNFDEAVDAYNTLRESLFEELGKVVDADNAAFAAADTGSKPAAKSNGGSRSNGGTKRSSGGGSKRGGGSISLDDALGMEISWGAFEGETLGTILNLTAEQCDETYGYGEGERSGRDYMTWLASDSNAVDYVRNRAAVIAAAEGLG